ncbi:MAG: hypothetical protein NTV63_03730 [Candidatus Woesearchaeota archaeon]|nr:hypothetical protein [Candidatus Woesearchaeota archaeon]
MTLKQPESMEEIVYYTYRQIGEGEARCWVFKEKCPKCKKGIMGKPREDGKVKIRAKEYVCPECGFTMEKKEHEDTLTANVEYTCPSCKKKGETSVPFKRKNIGGVLTLRVQCQFCHADIDITKKMKEKKGKKGDAIEDDE